MKPQNISFSNVKNRDGSFSLKPVTMVSGPNFSGKTSLLCAAKIAIKGYDPKLGKQHRATIQLAGEARPEMTVNMVFDTHNIGRTWKRVKDEIKYSETGELPEIPDILMDMAGYFGLKTEQDRVNYVFDRIDPAQLGFSDEGLLETLGTIEALPIEPALKARGELLAMVNKAIAVRNRDKLSIQDFISKLIADIKDEKKEADTLNKAVSSSMTSLMALHRSGGPAPVSKEKELKEKSDQLRNLETEHVKLTEKRTLWLADQGAIKNAKEMLAMPVEDTSDLETQIASLEAKIKAYKHSAGSKVGDFKTSLARAREKAKGLKTIMDQNSRAVSALNGKLDFTVCKDPICPFQLELKTQVKNLEKVVKDNLKEYDSLVKSGEKMKAELEAWEKSDAECAKWEKEKAELSQTLLGKKCLSAAAKSSLEAVVAGLEAKPQFDKEAFKAFVDNLEKVRLEVSTLNIGQDKYNAYQAIITQTRQLEKTILGHAATSEVLKIAIARIATIQQEILQRAFASLLDKSKPFTTGLLTFDLAYSQDKQELGYQSPAGWVSHKTFSDSEAAIAYAGLSVALAQSSPLKVVFLDEMGKLEVEPVNRKELILQRMCDLVEQGVIDAFFGADNRTKDYLAFNHENFAHIILA